MGPLTSEYESQRSRYARKKEIYQPVEAELLSKIGDEGFRVQSYHLLYNEEDPGTNHLIVDLDFDSSKTGRVEAIFPSSENEYDDRFFSAFEDILSIISTHFGPFLKDSEGIEGFSLLLNGLPVRLHLLDITSKN
ncbi:MAG: hypothetical protein RBG13Loki_0090 [Promethearchaeota archaeon CR_4]|nr:MAG: hypothetical protein RBG13Loki_0090 [Candidatus Lokiarchaeota archaeon CR_4]